MEMRIAPLWDITQRVVVVTDVSGESFWSHLQGSRDKPLDSLPLKMGPIACLETSVRNDHYSLLNIPEERSNRLLRGGSLESLITRSLRLCLTIECVDNEYTISGNGAES